MLVHPYRIFISLLLALVFVVPLSPARAFDDDHHEVINGTMLHFRVRGTDKANPYLLILHGGPGFSAHMFYGWGTSLEKNLNVVYLDQRGCGESSRLTIANLQDPQPGEIKEYTFATLIKDIEGVRASLGVDKWYVLGHSYGGMLGVEYVTAHPEHVRGYIHMDGLVSVPQMETAILDNAQAKFTAASPPNTASQKSVSDLRALPADNPMRLFGAFGLAMGPAALYFAKDQPTAFASFMQQTRAAVKPYAVPQAALIPASEPGVALIINDHFLTRDDTPLLAKIAVPTLILNGKQDGVIPPASAEAAHAAIKNSTLMEFDDCGHFPFLEQPAKTTAAILVFAKARKYYALVSQEARPVGDYAAPDLKGVNGSVVNGKSVTVQFTIDENGNPIDLSIKESCGDKQADEAARNAIARTKFQPAIQDGVVYNQKAEYTFLFSK